MNVSPAVVSNAVALAFLMCNLSAILLAAGRGGFWLLAGAMPIHVGTEEGVNRAATKAHVAYEVDDLAAWQKRLAAHSVTVLDSVPIPGFLRFEFRDPFGTRIELIQPLDQV